MSDDARGPVRPPRSGDDDGRVPSASESAESPRARDTGGRHVSRADEGEERTGSAASNGAGDARAARTAPLRAVDADLAPVIPLFGGSAATRSGRGSDDTHPSRGRASVGAGAADDAVPAPVTRPRLRALRSDASSGESGHDSVPSAWNIPGGHPRGDRPTDSRSDDAGVDDAGVDDAPARAEALLLRKLRSRSLSLSEARTAVRGVDGVDETVVEDLIARFVDLGYLDDAAFAEQLAMSAVEKRGEGRRAVAETLRKRGIPRDIAEAALAELPDDDAERALDFARSKVRGVEGKDYEASLRRLAGQLARRGYPSSVALSAAKTALSEAGMGRSRSFGRPASGVRFTPDD